MAKFDVIYREASQGETQRRVIEGHAEALVRRDLEAEGCRVLAIMRLRDAGVRARLKDLLIGKMNVSIRFGVSTGELALICEVFKALYSSGVPMLQIMRMTIDETPNPWLKKRLIIVLERLRDGDDVYTAMSDRRCRKAFPPLMRETIRTGEANGRLDVSLERLAGIFKRVSETKREIVSALLYPVLAFVVFLAVCTVIAIMIPNALEEVVGKADMAFVRSRLPTSIRLLFFLRDHPAWLIAPPVLIVSISFLWALGKRFHATRVALTRVERKVPLIGAILYQFSLVRFLDLLAANNETGIQVAESLNLIHGSVNDALIEDSLLRVRERILTTGAGLAEAINTKDEQGVYPGLVRQMVRAGEEAGRLTEMLLPIVAFYGDQARATLKRTLDMLPPVMIILLGSVIGPIVIGVYKTLILLQQVTAGGTQGL
jgi:type II secretory pathway component PulF